MKFLQINAGSLKTSHHLIRHYVDSKSLNVVSVSETWDVNKSQVISLKAFKTQYKPRHTNNIYGGVGLLHRPTIKLSHRKDLERQDLEVIWLETRVNRTPLLIASIYILPKQIYQFDKLDAVLQNIDLSVNLLLLRDVNARSDV